MINIENNKKILEAVNAILNNRGIVEIKVERDNKLVVVEIKRSVKDSEYA